jgi:hypothetical protein
LFKGLNPMTYREAGEQERRLAQRLRREGYAVWQG